MVMDNRLRVHFPHSPIQVTGCFAQPCYKSPPWQEPFSSQDNCFESVYLCMIPLLHRDIHLLTNNIASAGATDVYSMLSEYFKSNWKRGSEVHVCDICPTLFDLDPSRSEILALALMLAKECLASTGFTLCPYPASLLHIIRCKDCTVEVGMQLRRIHDLRSPQYQRMVHNRYNKFTVTK